VKELTQGRGVDLVIDTAGAATLPVSLSAARRGGRVVCCGATTGVDAAVDVRQLYWNHLSLLGSTMGSAEDFRRLLKAASFTGLRPVVDRVYPLEEYPQAARRMAGGKQFGKLVIRVA
jgi:NADPH:quinone reductase-like Zn-dependent oxidoreductase